jgi:hypothetical protein
MKYRHSVVLHAPWAFQDPPNAHQCNLNSLLRSRNVLSLRVNAYLASPHPVEKNVNRNHLVNATQNRINCRKKVIWCGKRAFAEHSLNIGE